MTTTHEFNQNIIFTNKETHKALVSHFNQIEEIAKNKKFEWEDEKLTETYGITFDFDEWLNQLEIEIKRDYYERVNREVPENLRNNLMNYSNQLKDYVNAFILVPVGMYKGKSIKTEMFSGDTFDEIVEHMKQVRQNNQMVFLNQVFDRIKRPKEFVIDGVIFPQDLSTQYIVLYGVL
jgi:hypothetical protein